MRDLTVIYLTVNKLPKKWTDFHYDHLMKSTEGLPLLTISRLPMPGHNLIQTEDPSPSNVYRQILRGAKAVDTEYIAIAEDDCLYTKEHFAYRPKTLGYNMHRWSVFTWGEPIYSWRNRFGNWTMIAKRQHVIDQLEERFAKYPNGTRPDLTGEIGRWRTDSQLGLTHHEPESFWTKTAILNVSHEYGLDDRARRHRKTLGDITALTVPHWGEANTYQKLWT